MIELNRALEIIAENRRDHIVVSTMSAAGLWPSISNTPLDFVYLPSTMGQGPSFGLGLALSHSQKGVVVINGDGCMLMNLGSLVTVAAHQANLYLIVPDNGVYGLTGGQKTAGSGDIDYSGIARAAGIKRTYAFDTEDRWAAGAAESLSGSGPVFVHLLINPHQTEGSQSPPRPMSEQIAQLRLALSSS